MSIELRRIPGLAPSQLTQVDTSRAWRFSAVATATAAASVAVGYAVSASATVAAAVVAVVGLAIFILALPSRPGVTTYEVLMYTALLAYLVPLLALGRAYATVGIAPIYVPDALIVVVALFMLPLTRLRPTSPFPLVCTLIGLLALHSVYVGHQHGYAEAIRGFVLALYPMIAVIVAGWLANRSNAEQLLSALPKYVLPLVAIGLAMLLAANASVIAAAAGLYIAVAGAFAVVPGMPRRRWLRISVVLGTIMLVALNAKRGPALTIVLAVLVAWLASGQFRSDARTATTILALGAITATIAITVSLGTLMPTQIPVAGPLIGRVLAVNGAATTQADISAANNVGIRQVMWSYALGAADGSPLFGVGAGHPIEVNYRGNDLTTQTLGPHNSFIGYAFYAGYPAAALVVIAFGIGLARMWRMRRVSIYAPALLGALVAVIATALTNVAFETTYIGGPSWLILAAAIGLAGACHRPQAKRSSSALLLDCPPNSHS